MKKFARALFLSLTALLLTGCVVGGGKQETKTTMEPMTVRQTVFSAETRKVLDVLDDEVTFFSYAIDETVQSMAVDLWFYEDDQWVSHRAMYGNVTGPAEDEIVVRVKSGEVDLIQIKETGHSKSTFPNKMDPTGAAMIGEHRLSQTADIVSGEEITLYYKYASAETSSFPDTEDFRKTDCIAGMAVTVTFWDEPVA